MVDVRRPWTVSGVADDTGEEYEGGGVIGGENGPKEDKSV